MNLAESLRFVAGSTMIYVVMAACSSGGGSSQGFAAPSSSSSGGHSSSSSSGSSAGGDSGSTIDADVTSDATIDDGPVPSADAAEEKPDEQSGSRLKARWYVGTDGSKQFLSWSDSGRNGETCAFALASDGTTRCLATGIEVLGGLTTYADAQCTQPLLQTPNGCVPSPAPAYAQTYDYNACDGAAVTHVFPIAATVLSGSVIYTKAGTTCTASSASNAYVSLGTEVPPSSFVQASLVTDP